MAEEATDATLVSAEEVKPGATTPGPSDETVPGATDLVSTAEGPTGPTTDPESSGMTKSGLFDPNTGERATPLLRRTLETGSARSRSPSRSS